MKLYDIEPGGGVSLDRMHEGQWDCWDSDRRFTYMTGGTQVGKTSFGPWWLQDRIRRFGAGDYLAVSASFPLMKKKMLPELKTVFQHVLKVGRYWASDRILELRPNLDHRQPFLARQADDPMWGRVLLGSADKAESLESATANAAWEDECGQNGFTLGAHEAIVRRLSLSEGPILGTTTPYNLGWLKTEIVDRWVAGDPDYRVVQVDSTINPSFPQAEFDRMRRTMPEWRFDMMYRGLLTRPPGLIYGCYSDESRALGGHMVQDFAIPPEWPRYGGMDFGAVNQAKLWVAHDPATNVCYAYREVLGGEMTTNEHCAQIAELSRGENMKMWMGGAPSETQQRRDFGRAGVPVQRPIEADVEIGIDRVTELIKTSRLYVFESCRKLRADLRSYSRVIGSDGEVTNEIKDKSKAHMADAMRYIAPWLVHLKGQADEG